MVYLLQIHIHACQSHAGFHLTMPMLRIPLPTTQNSRAPGERAPATTGTLIDRPPRMPTTVPTIPEDWGLQPGCSSHARLAYVRGAQVGRRPPGNETLSGGVLQDRHWERASEWLACCVT
jgi:hypothetical protein